MGRRSGLSSSGATASVLWLMILLVFLPIALAHIVARRNADMPEHTGAVQERAAPRAG